MSTAYSLHSEDEEEDDSEEVVLLKYYLYRGYQYSRGGTRRIHDGRSDGASYYEAKKYMSLKFYTQKNTWHRHLYASTPLGSIQRCFRFSINLPQ